MTSGCAPQATDPEPTAGWQEAADAAIHAVVQAEDSSYTPHTYAYTAWAVALRDGWGSSLARRYLDRVRDLRNDEGGWGLSEPFDAYQDGTVNPPDTTYTITLARHVGEPMLRAYQGGAAEAREVQQIVELLVEAPTVPTSLPGLCVAYSFAPADADKPCVHNVNAATAGFLAKARLAGFSAPGLDRRVSELTRHVLAAYLPAEANWPYMGTGGRLNDMNHLDGTVDALHVLAPEVAQEVGRRLLERDSYDRWTDPLGQIAILPLFCDAAPPMLPLLRDIVAHPEQTPRLQAQTALHAGRVARGCVEQ